MDALPLSVNRDQLELIHQSIKQAIANLEKQFSSEDSSKQEQNLLTYGTKEYSEAQARTQAIEEEVKSQLESWDSPPDVAKPVPISLDAYQLKVLQKGIENQMDTLNDQKQKKLLLDVIKQLPEFSLQEDAD